MSSAAVAGDDGESANSPLMQTMTWMHHLGSPFIRWRLARSTRSRQRSSCRSRGPHGMRMGRISGGIVPILLRPDAWSNGVLNLDRTSSVLQRIPQLHRGSPPGSAGSS